MDLILDTSSMEFQACGPFKPRLDKDCFTVGQERWHEPAFACREACRLGRIRHGDDVGHCGGS